MYRLTIILLFDLFAFVLCLTLGYRDLILTWNGQVTQGQVLSVTRQTTQTIWGWRNQTDRHLVRYQYRDHQGQDRIDEDILFGFPFALIGPNRPVEVCYSTLNPSISRLAERVTWVPWLGVLITLPLFGWLMYLFVVKVRRFTWRDVT